MRSPGSPRGHLRRGVLVIGFVCCVLLAAWLVTDDRVLEVVPAEIVRSARLEPDELRQVIDRFKLRTVLSLTDSASDDDWVGRERAVCADLGIEHVTISITAGEWPGRPQVERMVRTLDTAERPLLIHCLRGVDRVGWASAVSLLLADDPLHRALRQISPRTGHLCDRDTCPLHRFFAGYRAHLVEGGRPESAATFQEWVARTYCPEPYNAQLTLVDQIPSPLAPGQAIRLTVRVTNLGADAWRMTDSRTDGVRLGARIIGPFADIPDDPIVIFRTPDGPAVDIARSGLEPGVVGPGDSREFSLRLRAPREPGRYVLQIDMVDELVHWFSDLGWPGVLRDLEVASSL